MVSTAVSHSFICRRAFPFVRVFRLPHIVVAEVDAVWAHAGNGSANDQGAAAAADEAMQQEQDNPLANATSL